MERKQKPSAAPFIPDSASLDELGRAAEKCEGCELYRNASQTVFGRGKAHARVVLVGERPGDEEDRQGRPFVGPAGRLLNKALEEAGVDRSSLYVTNAVKHFKFEPRGKRRIHKKRGGSGDFSLPSVARGGDSCDSPRPDRLPGRNCCTVNLWPRGEGHHRTRRTAPSSMG